MMKIIQKVALDVADCNVNPRQLFACGIGRDYYGKILLKHLIKTVIARKAISFNFGPRFPDTFGLGHNQHRRYFLASTPPPQFLVRFAYSCRFNRFKVSFIHFCKFGKLIALTPGNQSHSDLL